MKDKLCFFLVVLFSGLISASAFSNTLTPSGKTIIFQVVNHSSNTNINAGTELLSNFPVNSIDFKSNLKNNIYTYTPNVSAVTQSMSGDVGVSVSNGQQTICTVSVPAMLYVNNAGHPSILFASGLPSVTMSSHQYGCIARVGPSQYIMINVFNH